MSSATCATLAAVSALAAWQTGWLAGPPTDSQPSSPPWTVTFWIAAWTLVLATSAAAAITGHDRCTRAAIGVPSPSPKSWASPPRSQTASRWADSSGKSGAALICMWCAAMLPSPLRSVPTRVDTTCLTPRLVGRRHAVVVAVLGFIGTQREAVRRHDRDAS